MKPAGSSMSCWSRRRLKKIRKCRDCLLYTSEKEKCMGCTNCIKRCPTEAIRVHDGKATIMKSRCIDCGECIRACPHSAKRAVTDDFEMIKQFKYRVALPAPALYSQYRTARSRNHFLTALKKLGFDDVFEVAVGCLLYTSAVRETV